MGEDLENKTKEELIRHIKMLNHNMDIMQKELDNSVSKEYYEMVTKDLSNIINDLKARLDNSVSKDEIKKLIEEESMARQEAKKEYSPEMQMVHEYTRITLKSLLGEGRLL